MSVTPARRLALEVVTRVTGDEAWAPQVLDAALRARKLDDREASFATRLAYGTVEMLASIDEALLSLADRPGRIRPRVMNALRVTAYELLWLETPAAVAVDQGVQMVRAKDPHAAGFANALLRRLAERAPTFPWGDPESDLAALARLTGFPFATAEYLVAQLGIDAARTFMSASAEPAPLYLALNSFAGEETESLTALRSAGAEPEVIEPVGCVRCGAPRAALTSDVVVRGLALVCDASAQVVASLPAGLGGGHIVDIGAGRGTKSALVMVAAARADVSARLTAVDLHGWKIEALRARMLELRVPGVEAAVADATDPEALLAAVPDRADVVLVDAPCSGTGTLRRHPEKRWRFKSSDVAAISALQTRILAAASVLVRPGGFMVYSTCSVLPAENMGVVSPFLGRNEGSEFEIVGLRELLPEGFRRFVTAEGYFQSMPEPDGPDGHFAVVLRRR